VTRSSEGFEASVSSSDLISQRVHFGTWFNSIRREIGGGCSGFAALLNMNKSCDGMNNALAITTY
jgi:hypothetical protein